MICSEQTSKDLIVERFGCPGDFVDFVIKQDLPKEPGFFRFGANAVCYGQCSDMAHSATRLLGDSLHSVVINRSYVELPFDPVQVINNFLMERYRETSPIFRKSAVNAAIRNLYYTLRPLLNVSVRSHLQRLYFRSWKRISFPQWPVDCTVESVFEQLLILAMKSKDITTVPFIWFWPDGAPSCTMMTHDVETQTGLKFCPKLMDIDDAFGIKSSFQLVPEKRYSVSPKVLEQIRARGFEVNVHDLNHDGRLMASREEFSHRVKLINAWGRRFGALGFRSAIMYRNAEWHRELEFSYDMSIPNMAHLEPQQGGCCTVFPFFNGSILELPLTTTQDYSLFNILNDYSTRLWKQQIALIRQQSGLISFIIHPDYIIEARSQQIYTELLDYIREMRSRNETWVALPAEVAAWWRMRRDLSLVKMNGTWRIQGIGKERARVAYAVLEGDRLSYQVAPADTESSSASPLDVCNDCHGVFGGSVPEQLSPGEV